MFKQLPLGISLPENLTFANFVPGENQALIKALQNFCAEETHEQHLYLWGQNGAGRSHLLQAACQYAAEHHKVTAYIPLMQAHELDPDLLQDLQHLQLICIDDVQAIAGNKEWEQALFYLYQRALDTKTQVIWSADAPPARLTLQLADLRSRLAASLVLQIQTLNDADKLQALQRSATERGLTLPDSVGLYLLTHCSREMKTLMHILEKLDHAALVAQRGLTIPFVKQVLNL